MTYHPNIPQSTDDPTSSQQDLLDNFAKIASDFAINHIPLTAGSNNGTHTKVFFPTGLSGDPNLASPASSLYSKIITGVAQLFFQNGNAPQNVSQLTGLPVANSGTNYGIATPWGITINFGSANAANPGSITFAKPMGASATIYTSQLTGIGNTPVAIPLTVSVNNTTLTYRSNSAIYYLVIGSTQ